jgi:DNA-binding NtrC family response regulator
VRKGYGFCTTAPRLLRSQEHQALQYQYAAKLLLLASCYQEGSLSSVMEAQDGSVAMDLVRTRGDEIDVILLDVILPGTSSKEVFEEAQRIRASIKVVLTSAYDRKTVDALFPGLRIPQFIRKPFQLDELVGTLRDALAVEAAHQKPLAPTSQNGETLP